MSTQLPMTGRLPENADGTSPSAVSMPPAARLMLAALARIRHGMLHLHMPDGTATRFGDSQPGQPGQPVTLRLANWEVCGAVLRSGDIGLAESFIAGHWSTDNLPGLVELLARNRSELEALVYGSWWGGLLYRMRHLLRRNSRSGSKKNIHAHYDLGNAFYSRWLDPSMTYSSALFAGAALTLKQAQDAKYARILDELQLAEGGTVLEIGCGWGGFAEIAAQSGLRVTGLTLSREQLAYAEHRLATAGLAQRAELRLCDYRDCAGQYDAIASIEMFEAVGQQYWPDYFACVARNLKPGGRACVQTITIADELFERYSQGTDFIQQYIFPGGMLPSAAEFRRHAAQHGLRVVEALHFGRDYAETLRQWRVAFLRERDHIAPLGFDTRFMLTWEFYLAYCEGAFNAGNTDVVQFTLVKD